MKIKIIILAVCVLVAGAFLFSWIFISHATPLSDISEKENYALLKSENTGWEMGGAWERKFLLRLKNSAQFEKDCLSFFSSGGGSSDAYLYCSYFYDDASCFSREYKDATFSEKSLRLWKEEGSRKWWRCLFSENKNYCYIHLIKLGCGAEEEH